MKKDQVNKIYNYFANKITSAEEESFNLDEARNESQKEVVTEIELEDVEDAVLGKRKRENFLAKYDWLNISMLDVMTCTLCLTYSPNDNTTFHLGSRLYTTTNLNKHATSGSHISAINKQKQAYYNSNINTPFENIKIPDEELVPIFKNILFISKNNLAISICTELHGYLEEYLTESKISKHYRNKVSAVDILYSLSEVIREELLILIKTSKFVSILVDESMDVSKNDNLALVIKYIHNNKSREHFLKLFNLENKKGETIFNTIKGYLNSKQLLSKLISLSTDGGSNMSGGEIGLYGFFKALKPSLIFTHCVAHKTNLVLKDLTEKVPSILLINSFTHQVVNIFSKSSGRVKLLIENENNSDNLSVIDYCEIRWTSNYNAMTRILDIYQSLTETLSTIAKDSVNAVGVLSTIKDVNFLLKFAAYLDVLGIINGLFLTFQRKGLFIDEVNNEVETSLKNIQNLYIGENQNMEFYGYWYCDILEQFKINGMWRNVKLDGLLDEQDLKKFTH
jgi:hypothetical protein